MLDEVMKLIKSSFPLGLSYTAGSLQPSPSIIVAIQALLILLFLFLLSCYPTRRHITFEHI